MVELNLNQMQIAKPLFLCAKHAVSDRRISVHAEKGRGIPDEGSCVGKGVVAISLNGKGPAGGCFV